MSLSITQARTIISSAFAAGGAADMQPLAVLVLDAGGHPLAFERQDGASFGRFDIANGKARGALSLGIGSRALMARAEVAPSFVAAATAALGGTLIPVPGGVIVADEDGRHIGVVGVSGDNSDNDEVAAVAGIRAAGLTPVTG